MAAKADGSKGVGAIRSAMKTRPPFHRLSPAARGGGLHLPGDGLLLSQPGRPGHFARGCARQQHRLSGKDRHGPWRVRDRSRSGGQGLRRVLDAAQNPLVNTFFKKRAARLQRGAPHFFLHPPHREGRPYFQEKPPRGAQDSCSWAVLVTQAETCLTTASAVPQRGQSGSVSWLAGRISSKQV